MEKERDLQTLIYEQKALVEEMDREYQILLNSDLHQDNRRLLKEREELTQQLTDIWQELTDIQEENRQLRSTVFDYAYSEKSSLVGNAEKKADVYFLRSETEQVNRLAQLERKTRARLQALRQTLHQSDIAMEADFSQRLEQLSVEISQELQQALREREEGIAQMAQQASEEFDELKKEPITEEQLQKASRQKNIESFVGLNLLNRIGILLIVIGVFAASQFAYFRLPDTLKGALIFLLGVLMLVGGEIASRKRSGVVSLGIIAGGIAVLYLGLGISFFGLKILSMTMALLLCLLITAVAFVLSVRHNSQVIATFALIGGYLPFFSILDNQALLLGSMVYFLALHLLVLLLSFQRKWRIPSFLGLVLNILSTSLVTHRALLSFRNDTALVGFRSLLLLYPLLSFAIYTTVPLVSTYRTKDKFHLPDIVFLAINTFFSSIVFYQLLFSADLLRLRGLTAVFFALIYFVISKLVEKRFVDETRIADLFLLTALTFVILVIPFQFGVRWLTIGWLIEGVLLACYGILKDEKIFQRVGYAIFGLCLASFVFVDLLFYQRRSYFLLKYSFITVGSLLILGALLYKGSLMKTVERLFQYVALSNLWIYFIYIIHGELYYFVDFTPYDTQFLLHAFSITITFIMAYILVRLPVLRGTGIRVFATVLYSVGTLWAFGANIGLSPFQVERDNTTVVVLGTLILIGLALVSLFAVYDLGRLLVIEGVFSLRALPLLVSAYFLVLLTQNLISHYHLSFSSIVLSIVYALMAVVWIYLGFVRQLVFMRRFGLALALTSVVKLVLIDLATLTQGYRIISYFALGIALVAISFIYQHFDRKLEVKEAETIEDTPVV